MRAISVKVKKEIIADPFYDRCCITGILVTEAKIDWHHNLKYAGKQVNEKWTILPVVAVYLGKNFHQYHEGITPQVQEKLDWIMLNRGTDDDLRRFSKCINLIAKRDKLNKKFGFKEFYKKS